MFDFEKLDVYKLVEELNISVFNILKSNKFDPYIQDQWKRASFSAMLNLAEGVGRISVNDKKHFLTISRSSIFECVSILRFLQKTKLITDQEFNDLYKNYELASKMLLGMFRSYK